MTSGELAERRRRHLAQFYGHWMTAERATSLYSGWIAEEACAASPSALCRACGVLLRDPRPSQQLHDHCNIT